MAVTLDAVIVSITSGIGFCSSRAPCLTGTSTTSKDSLGTVAYNRNGNAGVLADAMFVLHCLLRVLHLLAGGHAPSVGGWTGRVGRNVRHAVLVGMLVPQFGVIIVVPQLWRSSKR